MMIAMMMKKAAAQYCPQLQLPPQQRVMGLVLMITCFNRVGKRETPSGKCNCATFAFRYSRLHQRYGSHPGRWLHLHLVFSLCDAAAAIAFGHRARWPRRPHLHLIIVKCRTCKTAFVPIPGQVNALQGHSRPAAKAAGRQRIWRLPGAIVALHVAAMVKRLLSDRVCVFS